MIVVLARESIVWNFADYALILSYNILHGLVLLYGPFRRVFILVL